MNAFGNISMALAACCTMLLAGCSTTSTEAKKSTVSINRGNFEAPADASIGNDIKTILAQGGLDANNPAASVAVAKADDTPKTLSTTATDLQTLVAQLSADSSASAVQTPVPTQSKTAAPTQPKTTALALAERPKTSKAQAQIVATTETTTFAPIGTPSELIPIMPSTDLAVKQPPSIGPAPTAKTASRPAPKAARVVADTAGSYKTPTVKRF